MLETLAIAVTYVAILGLAISSYTSLVEAFVATVRGL